MRFNLGPIPIIYAPFYTFPLHSRRESGLLDPQIWQSNRHGFVYHQPYYLNLAPNYDSTLYLTSMTNHGAMTSVEGRLLTESRGSLFWAIRTWIAIAMPALTCPALLVVT